MLQETVCLSCTSGLLAILATRPDSRDHFPSRGCWGRQVQIKFKFTIFYKGSFLIDKTFLTFFFCKVSTFNNLNIRLFASESAFKVSLEV